MNKFVALFAAMLLMGVAGNAFAKDPAPAASATCTGPKHTWQNFGADKFAKTEEEGMRKLPIALGHMVAHGCMPQHVADGMLTAIRAMPGGQQTVTLNAGTQFALSESGSGPSLNVVIGEHYVGQGLVTAVQMRVWSFKDESTGTIYTIFLPLVCWNWSLQVIPAKAPPPPPPPPKDDCVGINVYASADTGDSVHGVFVGEDAVSACSAWRAPGEKAWRSWKECPDDCTYVAVMPRVRKEVGQDATIAATLKMPVTVTGWYQVRVSRKFAESSKQLAVFCYELKSGRMSRGQLVRYDDYHVNFASIFYDQASIPASWKKSTRRELYWRFDLNN